jgi:AhpC/TSA family
MRRRWNLLIWAGFAIVLLGLFSYIPLFAQFPVTRDIPWVNFLLIFAGGCLLALGVKRAFGKPELYRGKVSGSILSVLSLLMFGFFCYGMFYVTRDLPSPSGALRAGQPAPPFTLSNATGQQVALSDLLKSHRAVVLIFYRGYW